MTEEITGTLEDWKYDHYYNCFWGYIYGDIHKRFADGTRIHTSSVGPRKSWDDAKEGDLIKTLNSVYRLGKTQRTLSSVG